MIKVTMKAGDIIQQDTLRKVVDELRRGCKTPSISRIEYKWQLSKRYRNYYGKHLNYMSDEKFLYGLLDAGEIQSIEVMNDEEEIS